MKLREGLHYNLYYHLFLKKETLMSVTGAKKSGSKEPLKRAGAAKLPSGKYVKNVQGSTKMGSKRSASY